ncbi:MAG: response regulator, partial [Cyanobacteria bacterium P01_A01_bin.135]
LTILPVATALEDLLSDLRSVEAAPPLEDGRLADMLSEAGELLASASLMDSREALADFHHPTASVERITELRSQVQAHYLPRWTQQQQIQQDFAQQGFDLVVLELEIALENLDAAEPLPEAVVDVAGSIIEQLQHIGEALQLAAGWGSLLEQAEALLAEPRSGNWQTQWPRLCSALKQCAQTGGEPVNFALELGEAVDPLDVTAIAEPLTTVEPVDLSWDGAPDDVFADMAAFLDQASLRREDFDSAPNAEGSPAQADVNAELPASDGDSSLSDPLALLDQAIAGAAQNPETPLETPPDALQTTLQPALDAATPPQNLRGALQNRLLRAETQDTAQVQIPVPLARLNRSAQDLISALLSIRSTRGVYNVLEGQILQLSTLAQEGVQYISRLRQIQDDYALVDDMQEMRSQGPTPERYRQGYVTINRLLETSLRLSELGAEAEKTARDMSDSLQTLDSNILGLQATVEQSRLVPFRNLAFRARAILRDLTTRFGKPAKLVIQGEQIELDVGSARSLEPALLHLIRNAFDHAQEPPAERQALGKPRQGTLTLSLQRLGNLYRLSLADDGRGIDAQAISDRARAMGLPLTDTSTPDALLAVICQPGFSVKSSASDVSGRGVGMDVVAAQLADMGGKLTLKTALGKGTTVSLQFPVPHLLVPCLLLRAGDRRFAIPFEDAKHVALLDQLDALPPRNSGSLPLWQIETEGHPLPGLDLLTYWQRQPQQRVLENSAVCAYIQPVDNAADDGQGLWLIADEMIGQSDLLINALPAPLQPPEGMIGVSLQPDGTLVPVLNGTAIAAQLQATAKQPLRGPVAPDQAEPPASEPPIILIVDDAALMRRRIEASLSANGHITRTCADGLEAWNWLQANPAPALLITDIEMPHMDGFTLIDRCRQAQMTMPILVVSSRLSEDWFTEARRLGATDYLTKGFSTVDLLNRVNHLAAVSAR